MRKTGQMSTSHNISLENYKDTHHVAGDLTLFNDGQTKRLLVQRGGIHTPPPYSNPVYAARFDRRIIGGRTFPAVGTVRLRLFHFKKKVVNDRFTR